MYSLPLLIVVGARLALGQSDLVVLTTDLTSDGTTVSATVNQTMNEAFAQAGLADAGFTGYPGNVSDDALRLVGEEGCDNWQMNKIYSGWYDAYKLMDFESGNINWNEAAALEFLGPPAMNLPQRAQISALYKNLQSMKNHWVPYTGWRLHVRCDDPDHLCLCATDPQAKTYALTTNRDKKSGLARINFCPEYFNLPSLNDVINDGKAEILPELKYDLSTYTWNKGNVWYHELMHIDWVSKARRYGSNPHITDMNIRFFGIDGVARQGKAYGALWTKILARYPIDTGSYVWQNADNLNLYTLASYVQSQLGNIYPNFPVVSSENLRSPWKDFFASTSNRSLTLNTSNTIAAEMISGPNFQGCGDDVDPASTSVAALTMTSLYPDSSYPADYQSTLSAWVASQTQGPVTSVATVSVTASPTNQAPPCWLITTASPGPFCTCDFASVSINTAIANDATVTYCATSGSWGSQYPVATGSTSAGVTQLSDSQPQVPTSTSAPTIRTPASTPSLTSSATCQPTYGGDCTAVAQCGCPTSATLQACSNGKCACDC